MVTDSISDFFFTTSRLAGENLLREGKTTDQIFFVGNTMIDTLRKNEHRFKKPNFWQSQKLETKNYFVLTLHRPSNVDHREQLTRILNAINRGSENKKIIFPIHPRTRKNMEQFNLPQTNENLLLVEPQGYLEFNYLVNNSLGVVTDSGGVTEETTALGIPCITLRTSTERPETCTVGTNELIGVDEKLIESSVRKMKNDNWKKGGIPELWDGKTAARITDLIANKILR